MFTAVLETDSCWQMRLIGDCHYHNGGAGRGVTNMALSPMMTTVHPKYTVYQGFEVLFHSVECYIAASADLMSEMNAL